MPWNNLVPLLESPTGGRNNIPFHTFWYWLITNVCWDYPGWHDFTTIQFKDTEFFIYIFKQLVRYGYVQWDGILVRLVFMCSFCKVVCVKMGRNKTANWKSSNVSDVQNQKRSLQKDIESESETCDVVEDVWPGTVTDCYTNLVICV